MRLSHLFEIQDGLDFHIRKEKGLLEENLIEEKILGLQVKVAELANKQGLWKFWSNRNASTYDDHSIMNSYVDALNLLISLAIEIRVPPKRIAFEDDFTGDSVAEGFNNFFALTNTLYAFLDPSLPGTIATRDIDGAVSDMFNSLIGIGEKYLGLKWIEVEDIFMDKNAFYHQRFNYVKSV